MYVLFKIFLGLELSIYTIYTKFRARQNQWFASALLKSCFDIISKTQKKTQIVAFATVGCLAGTFLKIDFPTKFSNLQGIFWAQIMISPSKEVFTVSKC